MGNRIAKHIYNNGTSMLEKSTYYILDAQGNTLSTYDHVVDTGTVKYYLKERQIYGSSRLGMNTTQIDMFDTDSVPGAGVWGNRYYELSNHLGNVLTVINDEITPLSSNGTTVDSYQVGIVSVGDFSGFGVELDGRTLGERTRHSFQGQERDDEIKGEGNSVNYKYRMHDPRVGRFLSIDPLASKYPHNSPYAFSENVVINAVELEGAERKYTFNSIHTTKKFLSIYGDFQKGTKTFDEVTKYLDSRTGYRMGDEARDIVRSRLSQGNDKDYLGLDKQKGVPYIATDKDIANDNFIIVSVILPTKDGGYDRNTFEIVRDGYVPSTGSAYVTGMGIRTSVFDEGGAEAGNIDERTSGVMGMYNAADDIDFIGDKISYIPTPFTKTVGGAIGTGADVLRTIADYNTLDATTATKNLVKRAVAFGVDKALGSIIDKNKNGVKKYIEDQAVRKTVDKVKDANTEKP